MVKVTLIVFLFLLPFSILAQVEHTSEIFQTLKIKDSLLFSEGFNNRDIHQFEDLLSENFEFYHDEAGLTRSKETFITSVKDFNKLSYTPRRELVENSLEVFPLEKNGSIYGAIQTGQHRFYSIEKGKPEKLTSIGRFTHVWILEQGKWKLTRVLSYDHKEPENEIPAGLFSDRAVTDKWLVKKRVPALGIAYIHEGKVANLAVYGKNDNGKPNPDNTIFNVASLTKPITAMVALQLINAGKWNLDEPIAHYWIDPDIAADPRATRLTTRHILSHQTGFPNWRDKTKSGKLSFEFDPGTKYQYSGEGYEYLRKALEKKFARPLDQLANELLFKPLGMNDTHFFWNNTVDETRFAKWHRGDGSEYETFKNTSANAADDLLTTVSDYSKFIIFIMSGAGLKPELYHEMVSSQTPIKPRKYFGLGWWADESVNNKENALVHGGDDMGVHTIAFVLPESKEGLVIFTNCDNGTDVYIPTVQFFLGKTGDEIINVETK